MAGAAALRAVKTGTKATAKIGKVGSKAGKVGAKSAKAGAKGAKGAAGAAKALKYGAAAAVLGGGAMYVDKKLKDKSEAVQACTKVCLPEGYDEHVYGGKPASTLKYRTLESVKAQGAQVDDNQPFCTADLGDCGEFCMKKCDELNPLDVPGAELASAGASAVGGALKSVTSFAAGGIWSVIKMPVYIMSAVIGIVILVKIMGMMKKPPAMPAAPPRYY